MRDLRDLRDLRFLRVLTLDFILSKLSTVQFVSPVPVSSYQLPSSSYTLLIPTGRALPFTSVFECFSSPKDEVEALG